MKFHICLCLIFAAAQAEIDWTKKIYKTTKTNDLLASRIIGGQEAKPHQFPWQVALIVDGSEYRFLCGGSLISRNWVLTAAHCVDEVDTVTVIMGAHRYTEQEPTQVRMLSTYFFTHKNWDPKTITNDIALIKLPRTVTLTRSIQLVQLPNRRDVNKNFVGYFSTISGWGRIDGQIETSVLRFVQARIISNDKCSRYNQKLPMHTICFDGTGIKGGCYGDSGGPMVIEAKKQVGIASFVFGSGCEAGEPTVFTKVSSYLGWIQQHTDVVIS